MKHFLLTGATGTIGSALVPRLLADRDTRLTLLVRAPDDAGLAQRAAAMRPWWGAESADPARVQLLRGDISLPRFGLDEAAFDALAGSTSHIVHCAASVKLTMTLEQARATAVVPTRTVLDLARRCAAAGRLVKVDLVSTVGVWGRTPGHLPERALPEGREFHNTYEAAKWEAERVIGSEGQGLPITVHRPSMVVGERGSGRVIHFQVFYHLCEFLAGGRTFGVMPELGSTRLDTIPVDWVADAICWASMHPETAGRIFHLCSGPERAIALTQLQEQVRQTWKARGRRLPRLVRLDRGLIERLVPLIGWFSGAKGRRALRGLAPVLAYLAEDQGFSNPQTAATLAAAGMPLPDVDSYLGAVLAYYLDSRAGGAGT
ncbi:MAG: SDR family oxidoreductase [Burkholderiales bacterium]|nr:SDR family oxidoreductase [Burkholderiales bacterium]MDE2454977.1 SDR family oxidoreductase [Burkholderiales bacterium]